MDTSSSPSPCAIAMRPQNNRTRTRPGITTPSRALFASHSGRAQPLRDVDVARSSIEFQQNSLFAHPIPVDSSINDCRAGISVEGSVREDIKPITGKSMSPGDFDEEIASTSTATATLKPRKSITTVSMNKYKAVHSTMHLRIRYFVPFTHTNNRKLWMSTSPQHQKRNPYIDDEPVSTSSPLATRELRINEGNGLNGRKAQKSFGGGIRREPLYHQDQARRRLVLGGGHSSHDSTRGLQTLTEPDISASFQDPFVNEQGFEENLSDGVLSARPSGSSTPRASIANPQLHHIDDGDDLKLACSTFKHNDVPEAIQDCIVSKLVSVSGQNPIRSTQISHRVKKHPSPSKKALQDLEAAFAIYTRLKPLEGGDKTDELATDNRKILASRDCNKSRRQSRPKCSTTDTKCKTATGNTFRTRHSLPFRLTRANSNDIDEL
ncbi:hypothetical protein NLG97_g6270 [Lecanicillium saksenae]|uniref:Uncharacterized protein n=1 Tax=Lecanicillium saksenae TaxID=468837 RepID=A0ACC1QRF2_9HYPO|nr:hypothetical protein NLG97_g6270 [Lecanicillium saksenae]